MNIFEAIFNVLIFLNLYGYYFLAVFIPAFYYIITKFIVFPLAANQTHEFVLMVKPEKIIIKKVLNRTMPFFNYKNGLYWFENPSLDEEKNQYHIYAIGLNQDIINIENRRKGKLEDVLHSHTLLPQIGPHQVRIPKKIKMHLWRHYKLIIDITTDEQKVTLEQVHEKQPFNVNYYHTMGIYVKAPSNDKTEEIIENEGSNNTTQIITLTNQTVMQQINFVQEYQYFSSTFAMKLFKHANRVERNFVRWVIGGIDPVILAIIAGMAISITAIILYQQHAVQALGNGPPV